MKKLILILTAFASLSAYAGDPDNELGATQRETGGNGGVVGDFAESKLSALRKINSGLSDEGMMLKAWEEASGRIPSLSDTNFYKFIVMRRQIPTSVQPISYDVSFQEDVVKVYIEKLSVPPLYENTIQRRIWFIQSGFNMDFSTKKDYEIDSTQTGLVVGGDSPMFEFRQLSEKEILLATFSEGDYCEDWKNGGPPYKVPAREICHIYYLWQD